MKKFIIVIVFSLFFISLFADFQINQALIDTLTVKAKDNIKNLPSDVQESYDELLAKYPDGIMAYLISTENSGALWDVNPKVIEENYQVLKKLFAMEDYEKYPDEFVLSYIAKTAVSYEKITNYRKVLDELGLLDYVTKYPDLNERIRQITLWTREKMTFVSTSGRTQDPLSVLLNSNVGRCGEMQVFYISVLRTIGIPARPAWTPWWAHTDNNHAWTEIFVDGKWQYAESTSPSYFLNQTWFSASSQKALLILARSSFPDSTDDVVSKGKNNNYVNSTRYYQDTREVTLHIFDENNNPVDTAYVNICAYNFSMFRPLLTLKADSTGTSTFTIGKGGFLAIAYKDSLFDYIQVPYSENKKDSYNLTLKNRDWKDFDFTMQYPKGEADKKPNPEEFQKLINESEEKYNELIKSFDEKPIPDYAPQDSTFMKVFKECRNNKKPLLQFVKNRNDIPEDFWAKLLQIDKKFLWQANELQFENIYNTYLKLVKAEVSDDDFPNLLSPSIFYEILPESTIPEDYIVKDNLDGKDKIHKAIEIIHSKHKINDKKAVSGLLSLDTMLKAENLRDFHFKTLSCYVLRANYIPAQYTRIPEVILVKADSVWKNYNVIKNDFVKPVEEGEANLISVEFTLVDKYGEPITMNPDNIAVTIFQSGRFYPNDRQLDYNAEFSKLSGELDKGKYQVQFCIRESGEITKTKLVSLDLDKQIDVKQTLIFKDFKRNWKNADASYLDFVESFTDKDSDCVILLGNYDFEPPQRLATKIRSKLSDQKFVWIGSKESINQIPNYVSSEKYDQFLDKHPELKNRLITFYYDNENDKWKIFEGNWDLLYK